MIRKYLPADKEKVLKLLHLNTPKYFHPEEEQGFIDYLDNELEDYFVIDNAGEVIGVGGINYFPEEKSAYISWDIIHPHHQGKGLGKQLLEHRLQILGSKSEVQVIVVRTTQLTDKFYEKSGFKLKQTKKDYWAPGMDLYYMEIIK